MSTITNKDFTEEEKKIMQIAAEISNKVLNYLTSIQPYETNKEPEIFDSLTDQGNILFWGKIITNIVSPLVHHISLNTNYPIPDLLNLIDCNLRRVFTATN